MSSYVDNNVLYASESKRETIKNHLSKYLTKISERFTENFMILNPHKSHYKNLRKDTDKNLGKDTVNGGLKFCDEELDASTLEKTLGIEIDHNLNFENHIKTLFSKAAKKLNVL